MSETLENTSKLIKTKCSESSSDVAINSIKKEETFLKEGMITRIIELYISTGQEKKYVSSWWQKIK